MDTVFRYDPRYNKWTQVACLNEKRTFFHLSALKGHLYAVGGRNAAGELGESGRDFSVTAGDRFLRDML